MLFVMRAKDIINTHRTHLRTRNDTGENGLRVLFMESPI